jgi:hypothetical protein
MNDDYGKKENGRARKAKKERQKTELEKEKGGAGVLSPRLQ